MRITVLVDNNTFIDRYFIAEPGVSYFIESEGKKILFDVGYSDVFLVNAHKLGINLLKLDMVVLSHGHLDHTWGLSHLVRFFAESRIEGTKTKKPILIAHPMVFASRSNKSDPEIGSLLKEHTLEKFFDLKLSRVPVNITGELIFLGEIVRLNDFEGKQSIGTVSIEGVEIPDLIVDDSALAYSSAQGLVIITGCSHSGICNIVEYARKVSGKNQVMDVIGGFHLLNPSHDQLQGTVEYFRRLKPRALHACHCTDLKSKITLAEVVDLKEVGVGLTLEF